MVLNLRNDRHAMRRKGEHNHIVKCPSCYIVPPKVIENIIKRGNDKQKAWALGQLPDSVAKRTTRRILPSVIATFGRAIGLNRIIFDAESQMYKGTHVRSEGQGKSKDDDVNRAYDYSGDTYKFYNDNYEWNSINDKGYELKSTVHYGAVYNNAFWDGSEMYYGDGDRELFNTFTTCKEIVGHELTHGVVSFTADLEYRFQSGALNESFADVFGVLVRQFADNKTVDADEKYWLVGEGLFTSGVKGRAIRDMANPGTAYDDPLLGKDPQPAHMNDYADLPETDDNGGVHINSGIPNKAFYNVAMELGGKAWEKAGKIWFWTLRDRLTFNSKFENAAIATFDAAGALYGSGSTEQEAVRKGWQNVGVNAA